MPIPSSAIEKPEIVWATPDDTLEQVRDRLEGPQIQNKWRAFVLVRSSDGRYSAVSVFEIQPVVWTEGPPALKRPLRDLGLLHFQPGVEQDAVDLTEAQQMADQHAGWLIVLRQGHYMGLVQGRRRRSIPVKPRAAFDLFDQMVPDSVLAQTEFVEATLSTTVAKVAADLKSKQHPEQAYVLAKMDDGAFRVISSRELNALLQQADGDLWRMPLRHFASHMQGVVSRDRGMTSHEQVKELAKGRLDLVVTDEGRPVGLILGSRRQASSPQGILTEALGYDLFDVPQELLSGYPAEAALEQEPRFVNIWFEDPKEHEIERSQPLVLGRTYHLALVVGRLRARSIVDWQRTPGGPQAIVEPQEEEATLYASVFSEDFEIEHHTRTLTLPTQGDSGTLFFAIRPLRRTFGEGDLASLDVCLYYRCNLVQSFEVRVEVLGEGEAPRTEAPQRAELKAARIEKYPDLDQVAPKQLNLTITKLADGAYLFHFMLAPEAMEDPRWEAIRFGYPVTLRREDLTHLITKARRQLYNVARSRAYQQDVAGDPLTYKKAMQALALLGRQLYSKLFELDGPDSPARTIAEWIKDNLPEGSTIQVIDRAREFVFPWSLVYDSIPWDEAGLSQNVDLQGFWGWRYQIELLTDELTTTYRTSGVEIDVADGLRIAVGLNGEIPKSAEQRELFESLSVACGERAEHSLLESSSQVIQLLQQGRQQIFYAFCHGFTERMAADIQIGDNLLAEFKAWLRTLPYRERIALKDQEGSLFNVGDSWIKLTYGEVPLTMMQYYAADRIEGAPLVFLNMCESAQVLPSLSGGFVPFFIQHGARGVIGTECPMTSTFAHPFSQAFFGRFLQGQPAGRVLWELRREFLEKGNPLGLAYTLYCDADVRLKEGVLGQPSVGDHNQTTEETIEHQVDRLWLKNEQDLYTTLGITQQAIDTARATHDTEALEQAQQYDAQFSAEDTEMGVLEDLRAFGQAWWTKLEPQLHDLLCNKQNEQHDELMEALADGAKTLAVVLAPALVAQVAALPPVAIVVATIAAKKIAEAGLKVVCDMWSESMIQRSNDGEGQPSDQQGPDGQAG